VGGGEAGALLAVYARLAEVEQQLAQSGTLGSALGERLKASEQQLQAMGMQVLGVFALFVSLCMFSYV
jgi:hypothetical protein